MGTSKGLILVFDYDQNLKSIIGSATKGVIAKACSIGHRADVCVRSCRIRAVDLHQHICRQYGPRRGARFGQHLYLGHF